MGQNRRDYPVETGLSERPMSSLFKDRILLFFLFPFACFVRFYGIDFGLPHTECRPDESTLVFEALSFFSGDLNPHFFNYPTLYMYVLFGLYILYFAMPNINKRQRPYKPSARP